jgi:hypothetical protein
MNLLRFLMLLSLAVWIGALMFFPFVAQVAFTQLPSAHVSGLLVRDCLRELHWLGFISGALFLAASITYGRIASGRAQLFRLSHVLIAAMLALTAISQFRIIPRMEALRVAAGEIASLATHDPLREQFNSLHAWSTRIEETVIVLGLIVLYAVSRRMASSHT